MPPAPIIESYRLYPEVPVPSDASCTPPEMPSIEAQAKEVSEAVIGSDARQEVKKRAIAAALYKMQIEQSKVTGEQPYPLASATEPRLPPAPRLQQFPRTEFYDFRVGELQKLESYGWVNKDAGLVHIPIEDAMRLLAERGRPGWPASDRGAAR